MARKSGLIICLILLGLAAVAAIGNRQSAVRLSSESDQRLSVATSFYPLYFFTTQIGGDKIKVTNVTPAGAEPHDYELTPQDSIAIHQSQLLVINGDLEPWAEKVTHDLTGTPTQVLVVGTGLVTGQTTDEGGKPLLDPHIWLSPGLAKQISAKIGQKLMEIDEKNKSYYQQNINILNNKFDQLDHDFRVGLADCRQKNIITSHAAFGYLAQEYGLRQVPITGLSPDSEPSLQQLTQLAQFARQNQVKFIFFESLASPKLAQTLAQEVGARTLVLDPLEGLSNDDLSQGKTYFTQMEQNLTNLKVALSCQ